jgi:hypothetical protein
MKAPFLITSLIIIAGGLHVFAQANDNPYYTDDLDVAVKDADGKLSGSSNVGNRWYNRSTAKSFDFPKLLNQEMSTEIVDGALDATASGPGEEAPDRTSPLELSEEEATSSEKDSNEMELLADKSVENVAISLEPSANIYELSPPVYEVSRVQFQDGNFSGSATNIRSSASSNAYITPEN